MPEEAQRETSRGISRRKFLRRAALSALGAMVPRQPEPTPAPAEIPPKREKDAGQLQETEEGGEHLDTARLKELAIRAKKGDWQAALYLGECTEGDYYSSAEGTVFGSSYGEMVHSLDDLSWRRRIENHQEVKPAIRHLEGYEEAEILSVPPGETCYLDSLFIVPDRLMIQGSNRSKMVLDPSLSIHILDGEGNRILSGLAEDFFSHDPWPAEAQSLVSQPGEAGAVARFEYPIVSDNGLKLVFRRILPAHEKETEGPEKEGQEVPLWAQVEVTPDEARLAPRRKNRKSEGERNYHWWFGCKVSRVVNKNLPPPEKEKAVVHRTIEAALTETGEGDFKREAIIRPETQGVLKNLELNCSLQDLQQAVITITYPDGQVARHQASLLLCGLPGDYLEKVTSADFNHFSLERDNDLIRAKLKLPFFVQEGFVLSIETKASPNDSDMTISYDWQEGLSDLEKSMQLHVLETETGGPDERPGLTKIGIIEGERVFLPAVHIGYGNPISFGMPHRQQRYWPFSPIEGDVFISDGANLTVTSSAEDFVLQAYFGLNPKTGKYVESVNPRGGFLYYHPENVDPEDQLGLVNPAKSRTIIANGGAIPLPLMARGGVAFFRERGPTSYYTQTEKATNVFWYYKSAEVARAQTELEILKLDDLRERYQALGKAFGCEVSLGSFEVSDLPRSVVAFLDWYSFQSVHFLEGPENEARAKDFKSTVKYINRYAQATKGIEDRVERIVAWQEAIMADKEDEAHHFPYSGIAEYLTWDLVNHVQDWQEEKFVAFGREFLHLDQEDLDGSLLSWKLAGFEHLSFWWGDWWEEVAIEIASKVIPLDEMTDLLKKYKDNSQITTILAKLHRRSSGIRGSTLATNRRVEIRRLG